MIAIQNVAIKFGSLYIIAKLSMFWKSINSITTSYRQQWNMSHSISKFTAIMD